MWKEKMNPNAEEFKRSYWKSTWQKFCLDGIMKNLRMTI